MKRFFPYYRHLRLVVWPFAGGIVCGVIHGIASGFGLPFMVSKVLPALFPEGGVVRPLVIFSNDQLARAPGWLHPLTSKIPDVEVPVEHILLLALLLPPVTFAIRGLSQFANAYLLNYAGIRVLERVRTDLFARIQSLHLGFFRNHKSGDLISRVSGDTAIVKNVIVDVTNDILIQPFTLLGGVCYVTFMAIQKTDTLGFLASLLVLPLAVLPIRFVGRKVLKKSRSMLNQAGELNSVLTESIQSPREIRAYGLERREIERFRAQVRGFFGLQLKVIKYEKMLSPLIELFSAAGITFAIWQIYGGSLDQNSVIALVTALYMCYAPLKRLGDLSNRVKQGESALARIEEVLHAPVEVPSPARPRPIPGGHDAAVAFENVTFGYDPARPVLRDIHIAVRPGETVALVGPSGSGKTTFINLIPRFYDVTAGRVTLNGLDIREATLADLRSRIALVSQQPILFNDTLHNNIALGRPGASREEIREAARRAHAADFIEALPAKWDTLAGERGEHLSGGQRQRVAIARAFLRDAPILILDEATSALDTESEAQVQAALDELTRGKTTFIIAHRFSTIRNATRILVFEDGRITAAGTHAELHAASPAYKILHDLQSPSK
ncbi:MAG: ABC transporter ATP-binding protein/permease [Opitutaceae bacterium]|jgi:subfamily B ATP-binding cassette protein MsbA|nr:ABC transporter ATP-binding protein/permease [Opitutaceae bacterium]